MTRERLIGAALCLGALALVGLVVAVGGLAPVRSSSGHWPITKAGLLFAMQRSIATQSLGIGVPEGIDLDDSGLILKGAGHFEGGCRSCHGAPGLEQSRIARSMLPRPPYLGERIKDKRPGELFFAVKHGLKFTGMPAWAAQERDDEVWAMVAFLKRLHTLDAPGYRKLVYGDPSPVPARKAPSQEVPSPAAQTCADCHGAERGISTMPMLAGQRRDYLEKALLAYARGERSSGIMEPVAASLDPAAARDIAGYFAALKPVPRPGATGPADLQAAARGREIAHKGIPSRRVPACVVCHGPQGKQTKDAFPLLAGQPADYLEQQLRLFSRDVRGGSEYAHLMQPIAARLTESERRDVSLYFESAR